MASKAFGRDCLLLRGWLKEDEDVAKLWPIKQPI